MCAYNPFFPFHYKMIDRLRTMGHRYLVSQTFVHDSDPLGRTLLLLTDYEKENTAKVHFAALRQDACKSIIDLEKETHREKLTELLQPAARYRLLSAFLANKEAAKADLKEKFEKEIRQYIRAKTNWQIGGKDTLHVHLEVIFGELYVVMQYRGQHTRISLAALKAF